MASPEKLIALDARVLLYDKNVTEDQLPKLAIRAYPIRYAGTWTAKNDIKVSIRPILPEDEERLVKFHTILSDRSVFLRYLQPMMFQERVLHERLARISHEDYNRVISLVAETKDDKDENIIIGVVRLSKLHASNDARLSILIGDPYHGIGLGGELVRRALDVAKREKIERLSATLTADNQVMQHLFKKAGFNIETTDNVNLLSATIDL
jgi:acetyltransferase